MPTDYIAPFALWIVVRHHYGRDGSVFLEPAWAGDGEQGGLAVFVSRLDAYVYATLRNACHADDDSDNWQCLPLQMFDLGTYVGDMGGTLDCALTFGFACNEKGALVITQDAPRLCYLEVSFDLPDRVANATFSFSEWAFDDIRAAWAQLGAHACEQSIGCTQTLDGVTFAWMLDVALKSVSLTRDEARDDYWTVYDSGAARWIFARASVDVLEQDTPTLH